MKSNHKKQKVKVIQTKEKIIESLGNLKNELDANLDSRSKELWFKINSCIYSSYPHF